MRVNTLFILTIAACVCLALGQMTYDDCCLKYTKKSRPRIQKYATHYRLQELDGGCNLSAVIFTMKRGRLVCTDPKEPWVIELKRQIDGRNRKTPGKTPRQRNFRG